MYINQYKCIPLVSLDSCSYNNSFLWVYFSFGLRCLPSQWSPRGGYMCGADRSTAIVAMMVNIVNTSRHSRSTTMAANFQSFITCRGKRENTRTSTKTLWRILGGETQKKHREDKKRELKRVILCFFRCLRALELLLHHRSIIPAQGITILGQNQSGQ